MGFRIVFMSDTHLGYAAKCRTHSSGLNQRVVDGYRAFEQSITHAIESNADLVVHGGDIFHRSWPTISDIAFARRQLERLSDAGIPFVGTTGNHDAAAERAKSPATAAVHDARRGIVFVTDPVQVVEPVEGLSLHVLSHYALARSERIIPEPVDGHVNVLVAHGAAMVPDHPVFACTDSPGEQPIGVDVLTGGWDVSLLGHYHGRGVLPSIGANGTGHAWYAGSALRRGFSDPAGERGGLDAVIGDDGSITVAPFDVWQRPQFDLDVIDANGLTGEELFERIAAGVRGVDCRGAIIRQVVRNVTSAQRTSMRLPDLADIAKDALVWQPVLTRPDIDTGDVGGSGDSLANVGAVNMPEMFTRWVPEWAQTYTIPDAVTEHVMDRGKTYLVDADPLGVVEDDAGMFTDLDADVLNDEGAGGKDEVFS
jgi:hypothetical protein